MIRSLARASAVGAFALFLFGLGSRARGDGLDGPWPRAIRESGVTFLLYRPEPQAWDGDTLRMRAPAAVKREGERTRYGMLEIEARTLVDEGAGTVHLADVEVVKARFPAARGEARRARAALEGALPESASMPLADLRASLSTAEVERAARRASARNDPPAFVFRERAALLVSVEGVPAFRLVPGTGYERVVNTRPLLVRDAGGRFWLRVLDGWMTAPALEGPWTIASPAPGDLAPVLAWAAKEPTVDILAAKRAAGGPAPRLASGAPEVVVTLGPTELIVTDGEPKVEPIPGTRLLYWKNTARDVFVDDADGKTYLLAAGRWFRAAKTAGPWSYVEPRALPADFARIPPGHPKESVLASVPGTPQAKEALIANEVPQVATVKRDEARLRPAYDGAPQLRAVEGTHLRYVANASVPVIETQDGVFYAVSNGVWFTAPALEGPWSVTASVPASIYAIPPSSPLHYVTYVRVYGATPDEVWVGYTPGYLGTWVGTDGLVVFGTGYVYPGWIGAVWYPFPFTYGCLQVAYSSWWGWGLFVSYGWWPPGYWWGFGPSPLWGGVVIYRPVYSVAPRPASVGPRPAIGPRPAPVRSGVYSTWAGRGVIPGPRPAPGRYSYGTAPSPARGAGAYGWAPRPAGPGAAPRAEGRSHPAPGRAGGSGKGHRAR